MKALFPVACGLICTALMMPAPASASEYPLPAANSRLIGENTIAVVPADKRPLEAIAARYSVGLLNMLEANPGTDPWLPKAGSELVIPQQMLLPDTKREGIVVNLAELRLYYYPPGEKKVIVYPVGIGQLGAMTPSMVTRITQKIPNPSWTPTPNIRKRYAKEGITLPGVVPAGPDNPMGRFALRLAYGSGHYLIHGTNADFGIGMRVSSGCIRLRPDDIAALFNSVSAGTRVQIVNQPVKYAVEPDGKRYIEVHQPLSRSAQDDPQSMRLPLTKALKGFMDDKESDGAQIDAALQRRSGMPILVSPGEAAGESVAQPAENSAQRHAGEIKAGKQAKARSTAEKA
ncbi:putative L,D-transpeptidase YcfS [Mixta theicola]|nr:L,D-transpeptidase family protein [Mixta theicola]QHM75631.1 putative L,D-transpeptidase YcfS [Mixta theicola]